MPGQSMSNENFILNESRHSLAKESRQCISAKENLRRSVYRCGFLETWKIFVCVFLLSLLIRNSKCAGSLDEKRLIKHLLDKYERVGLEGRPVFNQSVTLNVSFGLSLIQILHLDEAKQVLSTNVWIHHRWKDQLLTWNPEDYGGVRDIRVPIGKIWSPDIVLYNNADERAEEQREVMAVVSSKGSVTWLPPSVLSSTCSIDVTHFPFDVQTCHLKFGSWTYDGLKMDINFYPDSIDVSDYMENNEWELMEHPATKNVKHYPCCPEPYVDLTFTVRLRRRSVFYNYIIILPCLLLSFLTSVIFWLPPDSPAKMMLGINVVVAFLVLLFLLADHMPHGANTIPLIGVYLCVNLILTTVSIFLATIVINIQMRGDRKNRVPDWLRRVTSALARVLCMRQNPEQSDVSPQTEILNPKSSFTEMTSSASDFRSVQTVGSDGDCRHPVAHEKSSEMDLMDVRGIQMTLRSYLGRLGSKDAQEKVMKDWLNVAMVFDRMFFFIYCSVVILSIALTFPRRQ